METKLTCKICVSRIGFKLSDKERIFDTEDQLAEHLENEHGQMVIRDGETGEQAMARCAKKGIVLDRTECRCNDCNRNRELIDWLFANIHVGDIFHKHTNM